MSVNTSIEWTDSTWNCLRGCTRVSEGCRNCYAEKVAYRFSGEGLPYQGLAVLKNGHPSWTGKVEFVEKHLLDPLKWGLIYAGPNTEPRSRRIFVNSMSDLFHENVTDEMRDKIFAVMALCPRHIFQVLTKRPERMLEWFGKKITNTMSKQACWTAPWRVWRQSTDVQIEAKRETFNPFHWAGDEREEIAPWPLPNVWLGVSVENQATADARIPLLLQTPAAVRFISAEPLLGPISLRWKNSTFDPHPRHERPNPDERGRVSTNEYDGLRELDWVICGGESGPGARPMHPDWARSLRDQCAAAGVPFFFKQFGEFAPARLQHIQGAVNHTNGRYHFELDPDCKGEPRRLGKKVAGALLDGVEHKAFPEGK